MKSEIRYSANKTMELIGEQLIAAINDKYSEEIEELDSVIKHGLTLDFFDILCLGYSIGIREAQKGGISNKGC